MRGPELSGPSFVVQAPPVVLVPKGLMRHLPIRWSFLTLALAILAACGDDGGPADPPGPLPLPAIDSAGIFAFASTTENLMQKVLHTVLSGQSLGTPNPFLLPSLGPTQVASAVPLGRAVQVCSPAQTGVDSLGIAVDSDVDGVPDDNSVDFGPGCSFLDGGLEYTFSGKYRLRDPGGGIMDWEYTTTALTAQVRDTLTGDLFRQRVSGSESAHFTAGHAAHQMDVTLEVAQRSGADSAHVTLRTLTASVYDPTAGSSFQLHGTLPQGTLGFAAELTFRDLAAGADSQRFVITSPTPVHTAFACGSGIDGGVLEGLFEGDERVGFQFTWPGCGAPFIQVFGTTP